MNAKVEKLPEPPSIIDQGAGLLKLLGGTKTTTSPGDTGALQKTFADLQGTDYEAMLKAIFQQAGGQIPGLQQALGNAIGARSGGNSAVQAALQKLLAQTSTGAMDQVAKLQAQNFATQANVGGSIAQATKSTTQKTGTDVGGGLSKAAQLIGLLQATKALGADKWLKGLTSTTPEAVTPSAAMTTAANNAFASPTAPLSTAETPMFNLTGGFQPSAAAAPDYQVDYTGIPQVTDPGFQYADMTGFQQPYVAPSYTPTFEQAPPQLEFPLDTYDETYTFADGGLVKKVEGYADGGTVRAGGSRRSANPIVEIRSPDQILAQLAADELRGQFPQAQALSSPVATASGSDIANAVTGSGALSGGGSGDGSVGTNSGTGGGVTGQDVAGAIGTLGGLNSISGLTGGNTLDSGLMSGLGMLGGLAAAQTNEQALGAMAKGALGMASPAAGAIAGLAMNPSMPNAVDLGLSLANPGYALANTAFGLLGLASPAQIAANAYSMMNPNQMMTPAQQLTVATEANNPNSAGLTAQANAMEGDALDGLMGLTDAFGTADTGGGGDGGGGANADGGTGDTGSDGVGGGGTGDGDKRDGGPIAGKGTGTSDSININVSDGEFVISADVVETLGEDFFNQLQAAFHTPIAQRRA
jgi:hypothetical protein